MKKYVEKKKRSFFNIIYVEESNGPLNFRLKAKPRQLPIHTNMIIFGSDLIYFFMFGSILS